METVCVSLCTCQACSRACKAFHAPAKPVHASAKGLTTRLRSTVHAPAYGQSRHSNWREWKGHSQIDTWQCVLVISCLHRPILQWSLVYSYQPSKYFLHTKHQWYPHQRIYFSLSITMEKFQEISLVHFLKVNKESVLTLLLAVAQDGNNKTIPIAFALVEGETKEGWSFFWKI